MTEPAFCTLEQVKQYLSVNQNADGSITTVTGKDDQLLNDSIVGFSVAINDLLGWHIQQESVTAQVFERHQSTASRVQIDSNGFLIVKTPHPTIQSVSALAYKTTWTADWTTLDTSTFAIFETLSPDEHPTLTSYQIRIDQSAASWLYWRYPFQKIWVRASYIGGYASTPPPIQRACAEWIGHDYRLRQYIPTMSAGFIGMPMTVIKPSHIPPHVERLLLAWQKKAL